MPEALVQAAGALSCQLSTLYISDKSRRHSTYSISPRSFKVRVLNDSVSNEVASDLDTGSPAINSDYDLVPPTQQSKQFIGGLRFKPLHCRQKFTGHETNINCASVVPLSIDELEDNSFCIVRVA